MALPRFVTYLAAKSRDKRSIVAMAAIVLRTNVSSQVLLALSSLILVRYLAKEDYGLWRVVISLLALVQLLLAGLDQAVYRFVPTSRPGTADAVVFSSFVTKAAVTLTGLAAFAVSYPWLPAWLNLPAHLVPTFAPLFWLVFASAAVTPLASTLFAVAGAHKLFTRILHVTVVKQLLMLLVAVAVAVRQLSIVHYVAWDLVLSAVQLVVVWAMSRRAVREQGGDLIRAFTKPGRAARLRAGWRECVKPFAVPLSVASGLSYIRGHAPIVLLGARFSLELAGIYAILKNILTTLHKTQGGIVTGVMPRLVEMFTNQRAAFEARLAHWSMRFYLARAAIGAGLILGTPFIFALYKIEQDPYLTLVFALLVLEYVLMEVLNVANLAVMMSKRTTALMYSAAARFVVELTLLIFVTRTFGLIGAAITLFVARMAETLVTTRAAAAIVPVRREYAMCALLAAGFVGLLSFAWFSLGLFHESGV